MPCSRSADHRLPRAEHLGPHAGHPHGSRHRRAGGAANQQDPRLLRAPDRAAALALRAQLLGRQAGRVPAAHARGNLDGARPRARRAGAAEPGRGRGRPRQDARRGRARASTTSSTPTRRKTSASPPASWPRACSTTSSTTPSRTSTSSASWKRRSSGSPSGSPSAPRPAPSSPRRSGAASPCCASIPRRSLRPARPRRVPEAGLGHRHQRHGRTSRSTSPATRS